RGTAPAESTIAPQGGYAKASHNWQKAVVRSRQEPRRPRLGPPWPWKAGLLTRRRSASDYPVARSRRWRKSDKRNVPDRECSHAVVQSGSPDRDQRPWEATNLSLAKQTIPKLKSRARWQADPGHQRLGFP